MAMFVRAANQFSPLFKEKNCMFMSKKMEILQANTKIMNRYCFSLIFIFRKLMFWLVDSYHVSFFYMTTTHGRAVILCMNFLLHGKDGRMLKLLKVDLREDCFRNLTLHSAAPRAVLNFLFLVRELVLVNPDNALQECCNPSLNNIEIKPRF